MKGEMDLGINKFPFGAGSYLNIVSLYMDYSDWCEVESSQEWKRFASYLRQHYTQIESLNAHVIEALLEVGVNRESVFVIHQKARPLLSVLKDRLAQIRRKGAK